MAGSNKLNINTPIVSMMPTINFFLPKFSFFSFTRVQKIATNKTGMILEDLNAMTIGKLVLKMATVYVKVEINTASAQNSEFFSGILTLFLMKSLL